MNDAATFLLSQSLDGNIIITGNLLCSGGFRSLRSTAMLVTSQPTYHRTTGFYLRLTVALWVAQGGQILAPSHQNSWENRMFINPRYGISSVFIPGCRQRPKFQGPNFFGKIFHHAEGTLEKAQIIPHPP